MNVRDPSELIEFVKGCCELLPNGNFRFTKAGKIRFREVMGEHGVPLVMDDSNEIREFQVTVSEPTS